jgi:PqqD family protein of HPr-rel-A system
VEGVVVALVKPKTRTGITIVELDDEAVIYVEENGELHHLNPTATIVFGLCDGSATMKEISTDISEAFNVPLKDVEGQVRTLVRQFQKAGLLEPSGSDRSMGLLADA